MGLLVKILLGLLLVAGFCIVMDIITFAYEYIWILPILIVVIFLIRFIFRPDFRNKVFTLIVGRKPRKGNSMDTVELSVTPKVTKNLESLKEMIDVAVSDGEISETEKRSIAKKGVEMGIAPREVELIINKRIEISEIIVGYGKDNGYIKKNQTPVGRYFG